MDSQITFQISLARQFFCFNVSFSLLKNNKIIDVVMYLCDDPRMCSRLVSLPVIIRTHIKY